MHEPPPAEESPAPARRGDEARPENKHGARRSVWRTTALVVLVLVGGLILSGVLLRHQIVRKAEAMILDRLTQRGWHLAYESRGWLPWRGLIFREVTLARQEDVAQPLLSLSNLSAELSWLEIWNERILTSRWHTKKASLVLRDRHGPITLEEVTADVQVTAQQLDILDLTLRQGAVTAHATGAIRMPAPQHPAPPTQPSDSGTSFGRVAEIDLSALRTTLQQLDLQGEPESLVLDGTLAIDLSANPRAWSVSLNGRGGKFAWRELPVREISGSAFIDHTSWKTDAVAQLVHGSLDLDIHQEKRSQPIALAGRVKDPSGKSSQFNGLWQPRTKTLHLTRVTGQANWLLLAKNLPSLESPLPPSLRIDRFPGLDLKDLTWGQGKPFAEALSVEAIQLTTPAALTFTIKSKPLAITGLTGRASFDHGSWFLRQCRAQTLGGSIRLDGEWSEGLVSRASLTGESLELKAMTPWLGSGGQKLEGATARFDYRGQLGTNSRLATGRGSVRLDNAPLVEIPLLDQTYRFFAAAVPGGPPPGSGQSGQMTASFHVNNGVMSLSDFKAQSDAVVVTGSGTLDFPRQQVNARARGELRGVAGWATQPLSRALEMEITGPIAHPRITAGNPVGIAGGLIQGTAEAAVDALQVPGKAIEKAASFPQRLWRSIRGPERKDD